MEADAKGRRSRWGVTNGSLQRSIVGRAENPTYLKIGDMWATRVSSFEVQGSYNEEASQSFSMNCPAGKGHMQSTLNPPTIALVLVTGVHGDDNGVRARVEYVRTPGDVSRRTPRRGTLAPFWDVFSNSEDHWHAIYVNWSLYFGADHLQTGLELAAQAAAKGVPVKLREHEASARETAGSVRREGGEADMKMLGLVRTKPHPARRRRDGAALSCKFIHNRKLTGWATRLRYLWSPRSKRRCFRT